MANSVKPDTDAYKQMMDDFDTRSLQYASDEKKMQIRMVREQNHQLKSAFDEIQAAVKDLCRQEGPRPGSGQQQYRPARQPVVTSPTPNNWPV